MLMVVILICTRRFGFVAFEKKEDCQRAVGMCSKNMFLIGNSARPVLVEMARTEVRIYFFSTVAAASQEKYFLFWM